MKRVTLSNSEVVAPEEEEEEEVGGGGGGVIPVDCYICTHIPGWTASCPRRLDSSDCMKMQHTSPIGVCYMNITMYITEFFVCHWSKGFHSCRKSFIIIKVTLHSNLTAKMTLGVTFGVFYKYIFVLCLQVHFLDIFVFRA